MHRASPRCPQSRGTTSRAWPCSVVAARPARRNAFHLKRACKTRSGAVRIARAGASGFASAGAFPASRQGRCNGAPPAAGAGLAPGTRAWSDAGRTRRRTWFAPRPDPRRARAARLRAGVAGCPAPDPHRRAARPVRALDRGDPRIARDATRHARHAQDAAALPVRARGRDARLRGRPEGGHGVPDGAAPAGAGEPGPGRGRADPAACPLRAPCAAVRRRRMGRVRPRGPDPRHLEADTARPALRRPLHRPGARRAAGRRRGRGGQRRAARRCRSRQPTCAPGCAGCPRPRP